MPYQALTFEEITNISTHICTTNLPSNIQAGTVSSLIRCWDSMNPTATHERRELPAKKSEFSDTDPASDSPKRDTSASPSPKIESPISTFPRIESYVSTFSRIHGSKIQSPVSSSSKIHSSKIQSPASTLSKTESPIATFPKKVAPVTSSPGKESRRAMPREKWHGKSWVKRDFVDRKNGGWARPADVKGPSTPPVETVPPEVEARTAETPMAADLWPPVIEEDNRGGLRRLSARPPTEQRRPLPESWYRSPQHDDDGCLSASASNAHLEKLKAIGRKHGLDFEPAEEESDCPSQHEQLQHKIHMRNHRRCHRCGEIYDFYNICLRCGHKCCRECPRSPSEKADEESWATTGSCSAQEERRSSSLLPMMRTASSYTGSASLDGGDDAEDAPPYIEALMEDIDNAITTAGEGYESSQGEESESEDSEMTAQVDQKQSIPLGGFPDSPNQSTNSLQEEDAQTHITVCEKLTTPPTEDFLSPDDRSTTKELTEDVESSQPSLTSSPPPAPQSSRSSSAAELSTEFMPSRSQGTTTTRFHTTNTSLVATAVAIVWPIPVMNAHHPPPIATPPGHRLVGAKTHMLTAPMIAKMMRRTGAVAHRQHSSITAEATATTVGYPVLVALVIKSPTQGSATPAVAATPQLPSAGSNGCWNDLTHSLRKIESVDDGVVPAAETPQSIPTPSKVPNHHQQSKSAPMTRRGSNEMVQTRARRESIAATTGDGTPRQTIRQGSVAARARAWEQSAATVFGIPTPPKMEEQNAEQEGTRGSSTRGSSTSGGSPSGGSTSGVGSPSKRGTKSQKTSDDDSEQGRASLHRELVALEHSNRIRVIIEILGDGDRNEGAGDERKATRKWIVEVDVDVDVDAEPDMH
ncbi:MAG: hypothetical protein M1839_008446 [Geoglossum umbratile]|nr:MAG: hypothetical protein M1839_008446 [Geoglossum umbratile]